MDPVTILVALLIAIMILGVIWYATGLFGFPANIRNMILAVVFIIFVIWMLRSAGLF